MNTLSHKLNINQGISVSVIVPAYNAAEYIDQCLNSIQRQSLERFEVIVVNDGSTDESEEIIERFVSSDNRFKLVSLGTNRGLPAARNAGVKEATGKYLVHIDSDDFWLDSQTLEILYTTAILENTEILRFNGLDFENGSLGGPIIPAFPAVNVELNSNPQLWVFRSVFLYFFNTEFLRKHQLSFDESIGIGEDAVFLSKALLNATNISSINGFFYAYRRHQHSMMGNCWDLDDFIEDQCASDIVISNLKNVPKIAEWYVFSRYTDYWVNKLLPRAIIQLNENSRHAVYERYRQTLIENKSIFESQSRVGIRFFILHWLLMRGQFRGLDKFVIALNQKRRFPGLYFGYYLDLAIRVRRVSRKIKNKGVNYFRTNWSLKNLLSKIDDHVHEDGSLTFKNDESRHDYEFSLVATEKKRGITAMVRVKNEEKNIVRSIESILPYFDEILVVDNASTDRTKELVMDLAKKSHSHSVIRVLSYPFAVARCGSEHAQTSQSSVHSLAFYYNWCLSQCETSHVVKWDADMILINDLVVRIMFQDFLRSLMTENPRALGAFLVQTVYLDCNGEAFTTSDEIHREVRSFPNEPRIYYEKGKDWEILHHPRFRKIVNSNRVFAYELKDTREPEFDHWATNSFTGWRKTLEYRNYLLVQAGLQSPYRGFTPLQDIT